MKSIIKLMRARESSLQDQKAGIDEQISGLRSAIEALGGRTKVKVSTTRSTRNYSHKPWTAERRRRFMATIKNKKLLASQKAAKRKSA